MRRFHALLIVAGLAAMPASAAAGPFFQDVCSQPGLEQHSEWHEMKGRLGVTVLGLTPELRSYFGAAQDRGILVGHIEPGAPARVAGVAVGDVIVAVRGQAVASANDVVSALASVTKGQSVAIEVVRDRKTTLLQATLADDAPPLMTNSPWSTVPDWLREMMKPFVPSNDAWSGLDPQWSHDRLQPSTTSAAAVHS